MRRLIVNADDFGLTCGVNRAILEAHTSGIVTSTTLMARGTAFADAVRIAERTSQLNVGCHVVLVDGTPAADPKVVPTLVGSHSRFRRGLGEFAISCMRGRINPDEIEVEATAQIKILQSAGIKVSHVDTHKHTHLFPQVLKPLLKAAKACGIRAIRNPVEPIPLRRVARQPLLWKRWSQVRTLNRIAHRFRESVRDAGMITPDGTLGIVMTGMMDERLLEGTLDRIPDGTWELVCHPGYDDGDLAQAGTRLRASRAQELAVLSAPAARELLEKHEIKLLSYNDIG